MLSDIMVVVPLHLPVVTSHVGQHSLDRELDGYTGESSGKMCSHRCQATFKGRHRSTGEAKVTPATTQQLAPETTEIEHCNFQVKQKKNESFDEYQASKAKDQSSTTHPNVSQMMRMIRLFNKHLMEVKQQSQAQQQGSDPSASSSAAV